MHLCAIYARVSTEDQGTSILNQQEYFKDYIKKYDCEIYNIYSDDAISGTQSSKRHSFQQMLQQGKEKKYEILFAKSYSRFGRNQRETLTALAELFEAGIRIIFVEDGLDSERDKGQFGLFAWLAEQESRKISERIKLTWQYYNKEGKIHVTTAPHGYYYDRSMGNFVVNEKEAEIVRLIFHLYLEGNGLRKICSYLNENGYKTKNNCEWSMFIVKNILQNEFYIGSLVQGKCETIDVTIKKRKKIDINDWIVHKNNHEAIITEDIFYKTKAQYKIRSKMTSCDNAHRHSSTRLFSNLIRCSICKSAFTFKTNKNEMKEQGSYSCILYEQKGAKKSGHRRNSIKESVLLREIQSELNKLTQQDISKMIDAIQKKQNNKNLIPLEKSLEKIEKQINEKIDLSIKLLKNYSDGFVGQITYQLQNESIEKSLKDLLNHRKELSEDIAKKPEKEKIDIPKTINDFLNIESGMWSNEMMKRLINYIEVDKTKGETHIYYNFQNESEFFLPKC